MERTKLTLAIAVAAALLLSGCGLFQKKPDSGGLVNLPKTQKISERLEQTYGNYVVVLEKSCLPIVNLPKGPLDPNELLLARGVEVRNYVACSKLVEDLKALARHILNFDKDE